MNAEDNRRKPTIANLLALSIFASLLVATFFFATRNQRVSDILHGTEKAASATPWLFSRTLWAVVSALEPRATNRCAYSTCPPSSTGHGQDNLPQFEDAFNQSFTSTCPDYFRWIHEDLAPWKRSRISKQLLETARTGNYESSFTVVIKAGRLYVDPMGNCYQTRAVFTIWGFLQLLRFYPGLVPDVELVFGCGDLPAVWKKDHTNTPPPPIFRYCTTLDHFDIPFPDWSFWGWPEVNIQPWEVELHSIRQGASETKWVQRLPRAFWKGNIFMGEGTRMELAKCNGDTAEILSQDWSKEVQASFRHSKLSEQCKHRYKVYVEGIGWSVSLKYIMACDSPVLLVPPKFLEFFARGLITRKHYWPVPPSNLCPAIASAVQWGNKHKLEVKFFNKWTLLINFLLHITLTKGWGVGVFDQAQELGKAGSRFVSVDVGMPRVYDYMLHALRQYASLLDFEPMPAGHLTELCPDAFLCVAPPAEIGLYQASMVRQPSPSLPCFLSPSEESESDEDTRSWWPTWAASANHIKVPRNKP